MTFRGSAIRAQHKLSKPFNVLNEVEVSKSALLHNLKVLERIANLHATPVLKANAYGHGLKQVASVFDSHVPFIAVDGYFEALHLKQAGVKTPILLMGYIDPANFKNIKTADMMFLVSNRSSIEAMGERGKPVDIHLEINSGMNRQGVSPSDLPAILNLIKLYPNLNLDGLMTHLADADNPSDDKNSKQQFSEFKKAYEQVIAAGFAPPLVHASQSAGLSIDQPEFVSAVRPGIAIYGINPLDDSDPRFEKYDSLRPAMSIKSRVVAIHKLSAGESVSYGYTYTAPEDKTIGTIPFGYYEGLPRALSNSATLLGPDNQPLSVRGRICMNHTMIDLTGTNIKIGDEITAISNKSDDPNSINSLCRTFDQFSYELLVNINESTRRVLVD